MSEATKLVNKRDFNSCMYVVDFPRPGHIFKYLVAIVRMSDEYCIIG